jgi:carbon dioxide concentrating mechanism protein CcmL
MQLALVVGSVTSTLKVDSLTGHKLVAIRRLEQAGEGTSPTEVAVDTVGAGLGDCVLIVHGSAARQPAATRSVATDLTVVAIVESVDVDEADATPETVEKGG